MARRASVPLCTDLRADDLELHRDEEPRSATIVLMGKVMVNLSSFIRYHASRTPDRTAIIFKKQRITYPEFLGRIEPTAGFLSARRIGPGDVVAGFLRNR